MYRVLCNYLPVLFYQQPVTINLETSSSPGVANKSQYIPLLDGLASLLKIPEIYSEVYVKTLVVFVCCMCVSVVCCMCITVGMHV